MSDATADYVELHCHSAFSLLDGASHPEALVERALALGMPALALTDHDELGGVVSFAQAGHDHGLACIIGAELTVEVPTSSLASRKPHVAADGADRDANAAVRRTHLVLLAESREGYGNLSTLITRARMDRARGSPSVPLDLLARHAGGLFALTGCMRGWVPGLVARDEDAACAAAATLVDIFDRRVAIECWDHGLPEERRVVGPLVRIARVLDIPWVVTNDVHYAAPAGRIVHDVLSALRHGKTLDQMGTRLRPNGEWYLKGADQMRLRWGAHPEGLRATVAVAERCAFRLRDDLTATLPVFPLPRGVSADEYLARLVATGAHERWGREGTTERTPTHAAQLTHELGMIQRLGLAGYFLIVWDIVRFARREGILCQGRGSAANSAVCFCLGITSVDPIKLNLLFERFLSDERREPPDIDIDFAHQERERVIQYVYQRYGREHAAMVCEQITYRGKSAVRDAARVLGFSVEQGDVLATLSDRFSAKATAEAMQGETDDSAAAPTSVVASMLGSHLIRGDEAVRSAGEEEQATARERDERIEARRTSKRDGDAGRASEMEEARKERPLSKSDRPKPKASYEPYGSPNAQSSGARGADWNDPHAGADHTERRNPVTASRSTADRASLLANAGLDPRDKRVRALPAIVTGLHQIPRHRSIHVGGFVLTREPLSTVVPIEPASMVDRTVIQWDKDDVEACGLVKIDLLGLGMLTLLQECMKHIRATRGHTVDLAQLDYADQAVYDDLCRADTIGIFQVESRAQMNTLPRLKPRCFYDLVVEVALIRPGPIQGEMVHPYLRRKAGLEKVEYLHPSLEPILKRTLGVPLFQEQGMQVAIAAAGFSAGDADTLRRAMGHKRSRERMAEICERMLAGMHRNGIDPETARRIYNQINAFADYGFPESHAASFALLVYASAYLKHYYAPEFTAAILNAQPMGFYAPGTLIEDAKRHGVEILPIDLTRSSFDSTLEKTPIDDETRAPAMRDPRKAANDTAPTSAYARGRAAAAADARAHEGIVASAGAPPAVRLGLRLVRGLGAKAKEKLAAACAGGPFTGIGDVIARSGLDRRSLRALAEGGAFDAMVPDEPSARRRRAAIWRMLEELRGDAGPLAPSRRTLDVPSAVPAMSPFEITEADYRVTGLSLNGHPMRHLRAIVEPSGVRTAREIQTLRDGTRDVAVAGLVICRQRPGTAKGFVFLTLEDETGLVNVVVTPKRFEQQALLISRAPLLLVRGTLQVEETVVNLRGSVFRELNASVGAEWARRHDFH